jgi:hypothetical protein
MPCKSSQLPGLVRALEIENLFHYLSAKKKKKKKKKKKFRLHSLCSSLYTQNYVIHLSFIHLMGNERSIFPLLKEMKSFLFSLEEELY